jgi:hypothetical protein
VAAPHNKNRYGEEYDPEEIEAIRAEIEVVRDFVAVSGGWAWHFMSPPHTELKHAHDHKDADLFVDPDRLWEMLPLIKSRGFEKVWTRFDGLTENFVRYVKVVEGESRPIKVIFDLFVEKVPTTETPSGVRIVEPNYLISLYGVKHSSESCFSLQIARRLLARGESPIGHPDMTDFSAFLA